VRVPVDNIRVGRVVSEDDHSILLEVLKSDAQAYTLDPDGGDRFLTVLFAHRTDDGGLEIWLPWEDDDGA
jgi:hypothetical protein